MAIEVLMRLHDGPGDRRAGDIITVKELPHKGWGKGEGLPTYAIAQITDNSKVDFNQYDKRQYTEDIDGIEYLARSKYRFDLSLLTVKVRDALAKDGFFAGPISNFTGALRTNDMKYLAPIDYGEEDGNPIYKSR